MNQKSKYLSCTILGFFYLTIFKIELLGCDAVSNSNKYPARVQTVKVSVSQGLAARVLRDRAG